MRHEAWRRKGIVKVNFRRVRGRRSPYRTQDKGDEFVYEGCPSRDGGIPELRRAHGHAVTQGRLSIVRGVTIYADGHPVGVAAGEEI